MVRQAIRSLAGNFDAVSSSSLALAVRGVILDRLQLLYSLSVISRECVAAMRGVSARSPFNPQTSAIEIQERRSHRDGNIGGLAV